MGLTGSWFREPLFWRVDYSCSFCLACGHRRAKRRSVDEGERCLIGKNLFVGDSLASPSIPRRGKTSTPNSPRTWRNPTNRCEQKACWNTQPCSKRLRKLPIGRICAEGFKSPEP